LSNIFASLETVIEEEDDSIALLRV
jgi:hypothetical protein